jgi:hypothetical protein
VRLAKPCIAVGDAAPDIFHELVPGKRFSAMVAEDSTPLGPNAVVGNVVVVVVGIVVAETLIVLVVVVVAVSPAEIVTQATRTAEAALTVTTRRHIKPRLFITCPHVTRQTAKS